ncbi:LAGLIDADG family homing endonuclease [Microbacterium sp. LMC-P-041]|uniref:LAGLIDADG family homing endonuclease n=1 Tax=Microbacterium sp. LMC-P-041 TaxID=3040293 RepID=UPI002553C514|nr:LAGLIDADG family homing endonuclease [Microbacterium sp. LMC-P-041]
MYVFNRRDALLAVASQRDTMLDRLPKRSTRITARSMEASIRDPQRGSRLTWSVETPEPFDLPDRDVRIPPWLLGFWLGDGDHDNYQVTVGNEDRDALAPMIESAWDGPIWIRELEGKIKVSLRRRNLESCVHGHPRVDSGPCYTCLTLYEYRGLRRPRPGINAPFITLLRYARVYKNKHVPAVYLRGSSSQRLATLQGLIDSDGHVADDGGVELALSDQRLASDSLELIRSLGIRASCTGAPTHRTAPDGARIPGKNRHRIHFTTRRRVASLPRKADRLLAADADSPVLRRLFIKSVATKEEATEMIALTIDDPAGTFLVEGFLPVLDDSRRGRHFNVRETSSAL